MPRSKHPGLQLSLVVHAVVFALVVSGLWFLQSVTTTGFPWAAIVTWGWGIGLAAHAAVWLMLSRR
ncbi:MAG: 2TM domain-containing protein [Aquabacterium sp.]|jgi:hypothetical protein|nr:MAG: 2TM domain-containing protein [Aquabacterium sp.]TAL16906.1 MAG: 2TM domain-containing protein [Aquabacterium sp.]